MNGQYGHRFIAALSEMFDKNLYETQVQKLKEIYTRENVGILTKIYSYLNIKGTSTKMFTPF